MSPQPPTHLNKLEKAGLLEGAARILDERGARNALANGHNRCAVGALAELIGILPPGHVAPGGAEDNTDVIANDPQMREILGAALDEFIEVKAALILSEGPEHDDSEVASRARRITEMRERRDLGIIWDVNDLAGPAKSAACFRRTAESLRRRVGSLDAGSGAPLDRRGG